MDPIKNNPIKSISDSENLETFSLIQTDDQTENSNEYGHRFEQSLLTRVPSAPIGLSLSNFENLSQREAELGREIRKLQNEKRILIDQIESLTGELNVEKRRSTKLFCKSERMQEFQINIIQKFKKMIIQLLDLTDIGELTKITQILKDAQKQLSESPNLGIDLP